MFAFTLLRVLSAKIAAPFYVFAASENEFYIIKALPFYLYLSLQVQVHFSRRPAAPKAGHGALHSSGSCLMVGLSYFDARGG